MGRLIAFLMAVLMHITCALAATETTKTHPADLYIFPSHYTEAMQYWHEHLSPEHSQEAMKGYNRYQEKLLYGLDKNKNNLQLAMIENGWAIYYSDHKINSAFATAYLKAEKEAQKKQKGIWADSAQNPLRDAAQLTSTDAGKILLVRGTVHDVHKRKDVIYLNFDDDWRRDFTIRVLPKNAKIFAKNGLDLDQLKGKKIEIRGYSEARNGIMIDWNSFWQVRVLAQD